MPTNYVLIDFENVKSANLQRLAGEQWHVLVFVGASQTKLPLDTVVSVQPLGSRAEYIQISGNGPNALDFHIAYYIGKLAAADPDANFHIVSADTGFDPLIQHLKSHAIAARRVKSAGQIPLPSGENVQSLAERADSVVVRLRKITRPRTIKTLTTSIAAMFKHALSEAEIGEVIQEVANRGHIAIEDGKVTYMLLEQG